MKIEICEQMVQSWLQHIKGCQIVQTNWMVSPLRMPKDHPELPYVEWFMEDITKKLNNAIDLETKAAFALSSAYDIAQNYTGESPEEPEKSSMAIFDKMISYFIALNQKERAAMANIFGKSQPHQFVTQCEIDVMGVKFYDTTSSPDRIGVEKIYLIDSAFHKGTLGYGDAVARVLKKIIRACVVSELVFGTKYAVEVAFATPDCSPGYAKKIADLVDIFRDLLKKHYSPRYDNIKIELYFNDVFAQEIYYPLREKIDELNNDNDLFMRSLNLAKVAEEKLPDSMKSSAVMCTKSSSGKKHSIVASGSATPPKSGTGRRYTDDDKYKEAAYYLKHSVGLKDVEGAVLGLDGSGNTAQNHLKKLGIDTSVNSKHKGLLEHTDIDEAIATASDPIFKNTLEEIKKRGL